MFDLHGNDRLAEWKSIRDQIEISERPLDLVADVWSRAPFVNPYLDPKDPKSWPNPWQLILDDRLDELAIALGMLYTIKLTQRFMDTLCEIHKAIPHREKDCRYYLFVDNRFVLNYEPRKVVDLDTVNAETEIIWSGTALK